MVGFIAGEVVVLPFPFSDLSTSKRRPALVLAPLQGDDVIVCQITSANRQADNYSVDISNQDFERGGLKVSSNIRPNRIFTAESSIIIRTVGKISMSKMNEVKSQLKTILGL